MEKPTAVLERKVMYLDKRFRTSPRISIPRWWIGNTERVKVEVYADKLVVRKEVAHDE